MSPDHGREAVYRAERMLQKMIDRQHTAPIITIAGSTITVPMERRWADLDSLTAYVKSLYPEVSVRVRKGAAAAHYEFTHQTIAIPEANRAGHWAYRQTVVLHELAHHRSRSAGAVHGTAFREALIELLTEQMGPEAGLLLRILIHQSVPAMR